MNKLLIALSLLLILSACQYNAEKAPEAPTSTTDVTESAPPRTAGESASPPPAPPAPQITDAVEQVKSAPPAQSATKPAPAAKPNLAASQATDASAGAAPTPAAAGGLTKNTMPAPASLLQSERPEHAAWNALLQQYVSNSGQVNYQAWRAAQAPMEAYLTDLREHTPQADWTKQEQMAYWINAYNAFTIKLILDNPTPSIRDLNGGKPWDIKWIKLGETTYSLNQIENSILRPRYKDARIHFALNCAAKSCPPLANRAFTAENLSRMLEQLTLNFVRNASFNTFTAEQSQVSRIFDWYAEDFGDLKAFLNRYSAQPLNPDVTISFKEYDWALNGR